MTDVKLNYYEITQDTNILDLDDNNNVAIPTHDGERDGLFKVKKGKLVKSFGQTKRYKTQDKKQEVLILVNGNGVLANAVKLFKGQVDDCGCDGNPFVEQEDMDKLTPGMEHKEINKESSYVGGKKTFNKSGIIGLFVGIAIAALIVWAKTKDKKKTIIAAIGGAILGFVIGYFIGKRGEKKTGAVEKLAELDQQITEKTTATPKVSEAPQAQKKAEVDSSKDFFQLGETYDFKVPYPVYAMVYSSDGAFRVAKNGDQKVAIKPGVAVTGKLVEIESPQLFVVDTKNKQVITIKSKKPLPFLDIGNKMYLSLSMVVPSSMITPEEVINFLNGQGGLDDEIYLKGRYAGKRQYNLMYSPVHEATIREMYGLK